MTQIITQKHLNALLAEINGDKEYGNYNTPGRYDLDYAYGGVKLVRHCEGGGQRDISTGGYGTKRELYNFMRGMRAGMGA